MEHFLESVADSVSQLVLFSVDPNEANKEAASLQEGARIVKQSAHAMQNIKMADRMGGATDDVTEGIQQIVENALRLADDLSDATAKMGVLDGSKKLLQNIVNCLQLTDIFQCAGLIKRSKDLSGLLEELRSSTVEPTSPSSFKSTAPLLVEGFTQLAVETQERCRLIPQPKYNHLLREVQETIAQNLQDLLNSTAECLKDPQSKTLDEERSAYEMNLLHALDDVVLVAKESSKGLFDNLSVDLDLMAVMQSSNAEEESFYGTIRRTKQELSELVSFTKKGDKQNSIETLKAIRPLLAQVSSHLSNCLTANDLVALTKACLLNPGDENAVNELCSSVDRLQNALDVLLERANLPTSLTNELRETIKIIISECEETIELLAQSVFLSHQPQAIQYAKDTLKLLNSASELAAGLADRLEDEALTAYFVATNRVIKASMPPLLTSTKEALLYSENRPAFVRAKDSALYAAFALLPPKNVVHPENQILDQIKFIQEHLRILHYKVRAKKSQDIQGCLKGVLEAAKESARAIKAYIPFAQNPHKLQAACLSLANDHIQRLGHTVMEEADRPDQVLETIRDTCLANARILEVVFSDHSERLEANGQRIDKHFTLLPDTTDSSDPEKALEEEYLTENWIAKLQDLINEQVVLSLSLAQETNEPKQKEHLLECGLELSNKLGDFNEEVEVDLPVSLLYTNDSQRDSLKQLHTIHKKLLKKPEGARGTLNDSSNVLLDRISSLPTDSSITGKLYQASKLIALDLKDLLGGELSRADMIKCARRICNQAHIIVKQAQLFITRCKDARLSNEIQVGSVSARTKCVQLKILCAVKAATGSNDDNSMEEQLVGCVLGLTKDLHSTISAAEIASLRFK